MIFEIFGILQKFRGYQPSVSLWELSGFDNQSKDTKSWGLGSRGLNPRIWIWDSSFALLWTNEEYLRSPRGAGWKRITLTTAGGIRWEYTGTAKPVYESGDPEMWVFESGIGIRES